MNPRNSQLGAAFMLGVVVGVILTAAVVGWQDDSTANATHKLKLNGYEVPIVGHWGKDSKGRDELVWSRKDQDWLNGAPVLDCPAITRSAKSRYTIGVNGASATVSGWMDGKGVFHWCYDDQAWESVRDKSRGASQPQSEPPLRTPGFIGGDGAMNFGLNIESIGADGTQIRASDPEIQAEVQAALDDCKPPESPFKVPEVPGSHLARFLIWINGLSPTEIAVKVVGLGALIVAVAYTIRNRSTLS